MHKSPHAVVVAALASIAGAASGADAPASNQELVAELQATVADLQKQVDLLKGQNDKSWLTEQRAAEIRGLVHDVLADADTRASLLQGGAMAGYDRNFYIASADGNYMLKISGQLQFRFAYNHQDTELADDENRYGFETRRTKFKFAGHVFDPSWQYTVQVLASRDGGDITSLGSGGGGALGLEIAEIVKDFQNGWKVRFGQFKPPFLREELVSSTRQLAVERSLVNEEFNQDYAQGVELNWRGDRVGFAAMVNDGFNSRNIPVLVADTDYGVTGRVEFLAAGDWKQFDDLTSWKDEEFGLLLGAAGHTQEGESGTPATELELTSLTADASVEFGGANAFAAIIWRSLDDDATIDADQLGFIIQGGFFFTDDWELFGRYEWGDFDISGVEDLSVITVGVNRYFNKHNLKWQTDIGFGLDEVSSPWASSGADWRADPGGEDGQVVVRSQFQLLF